MAKRIYVGNLAWACTASKLQELFAPFGNVVSAEVVSDRETGRSRGFGFIQMGNDQETEAAIAALNGTEVDGRNLTVNEARERTGGGGSRGRY